MFAYAVDLGQLHCGRVEHSGKAPESLQEFLGKRLHIPSWDSVGKEQFQYFRISQPRPFFPEESILEAFPMACVVVGYSLWSLSSDFSGSGPACGSSIVSGSIPRLVYGDTNYRPVRQGLDHSTAPRYRGSEHIHWARGTEILVCAANLS